MLRHLASKAVEHFRRGVIPVPESAVNLALPRLVQDIPEVERIRVHVGPGHFDVVATVQKMGRFDATLRFEIVEARISHDEQIVRMRQVGNTRLEGEGLRGRIMSAVFEALLASLLKVDPAQMAGTPAFRRVGDLYELDLGTLGLRERLERFPKLAPVLRYGRIDQIRCVPGRFELVPRLNLAAR